MRKRQIIDRLQIVVECLLIIVGIALMAFAITQPFRSYSYTVDKILRLLFRLIPPLALISIYARIQGFYKYDETKNVIKTIMFIVFIIYMIIAKRHGY